MGQKKYDEIEGMLYDGAVLLFSHQVQTLSPSTKGNRLFLPPSASFLTSCASFLTPCPSQEVASGVDLAKLFVESLTQAEAGPEETRFQRLSK